jgi:hypothetical protein
MTTQETKLLSHPGVASALSYPFFEAVLNRRSRRFSMGAEITGGPTKYKSAHNPVPLDELEEALLVQAATGMSGMALGDMPAVDAEGRDIGTNTLARFIGRTWPSPCASHDTELIFWNDEGTYVAKFKELTPSKIREFETLDDKERLLATFRAAKHKLFDGRPQYPRQYPVMLPFNQWSSDLPGSTVFLPLADVTFELINVLLLMCGWPDGGMYLIDDFNDNRPAGCERWAKEGLLNPMYSMPISMLGNVSTVETGFIMQNLSLAIQSLGLGGWVHAAPVGMALLGGTPTGRGLGFRFVTAKEGPRAGRPMPVGIDGVIEAYCPPYYRDMAAAVDAVVEAKFGPGGPFNLETESPSPYLARNEFVSAVPRHSDALVQCVKDICNYIYDTYGRFPSHVDPISVSGSWVQAHHLDLEFYDRFFEAGAYTETQARHMELWHGAAASREPAALTATAP